MNTQLPRSLENEVWFALYLGSLVWVFHGCFSWLQVGWQVTLGIGAIGTDLTNHVCAKHFLWVTQRYQSDDVFSSRDPVTKYRLWPPVLGRHPEGKHYIVFHCLLTVTFIIALAAYLVIYSAVSILSPWSRWLRFVYSSPCRLFGAFELMDSNSEFQFIFWYSFLLLSASAINIVRGTHGQLVAFLFFNAWPAFVGIPMLLGVMIWSSRVQRHVTFVNFAAAFLVIGW